VNPGELDSLLERAAELPPAEKIPMDPLELRLYAERAAGLLLELREALRSSVLSHGGTFAMRLRETLEERILTEINGRVVLTTEVKEHTVGVHLLPGEVIVDVRLRVGKERTDGTAHVGVDR